MHTDFHCVLSLCRVYHEDLSETCRGGDHITLSPGHTQILSHSRGEKSGEVLGRMLRHGLKWWTQFHINGNMPTQYAVSTANDRTVKFAYVFCQQLRTLQVANEGCVDVSGRCYALMWTTSQVYHFWSVT